MPDLKLKNGTSYPQPVVQAIVMCVQGLLEPAETMHNWNAYYYFAQHCKGAIAFSDIPSDSVVILKKRGLIDEKGRVHSSIKDVVMSGASEDFATFGSPVAS